MDFAQWKINDWIPSTAREILAGGQLNSAVANKGNGRPVVVFAKNLEIQTNLSRLNVVCRANEFQVEVSEPKRRERCVFPARTERNSFSPRTGRPEPETYARQIGAVHIAVAGLQLGTLQPT